MSKFFKSLILSGVVLSVLTAAPVFAANNTFKSDGGGYKLELPEKRTDVFRTSTAIRFIDGNQLVSADVYSMPNFLSVPINTYSDQQVKDFQKFVLEMQDYPEYKLDKNSEAKEKLVTSEKALGVNTTNTSAEAPTKSTVSMKQRLQEARDRAKATEKADPKKAATKPAATPAKTSSLKRLAVPLVNGVYNFGMEYTGLATIPRKTVVGKAYQVKPDKLLILKVETTDKEKLQAEKLLNSLSSDLKIGKSFYTEHNTLTAEQLGYKINLPMGWHAFTYMSDNIIMAKSLSTVHEDNGLIRAFKTNQYADLANATPKTLPEIEKKFVDSITKYTTNVTVIRHKPVTIDGLNGSIVESTDSIDLKKVFIINAYLFDKKGMGYQMRFNTDDTINYEIKLKAFDNAVNSFQLLHK